MQTKKLGEICKLVKGKKPSNFVSKSSKPYLTAKVIRGTKVPEFVSEDCLSSVWVEKDDIVIIMDGSNSGEMFTNLDGALASTMGIVKYQQNLLSPKYLLHFLIIHRENFTKSRTGSAIPHLNKEQFENLEIPLPPLPTQHRIVKILDEVFSDIVQAKEHAEKNLQNAKDLFESYLQGVFANSKYEKRLVGDICKIIGGGTPSKAGSNFVKFYNGDILWATVRDMKNDIIMDTEHKINEEAVKKSSTNIIPKNNVVIASRVGLGKICLLKKDTAINQDLRGIIPLDSNNLSVNYLFWWLKSVAQILIQNGSGATVHGIKLPFIKSLEIPLPLIIEQKSIVHKLDALSAETKKLEAIYQQKLANLEELKKSVLKKAFAGELVE